MNSHFIIWTKKKNIYIYIYNAIAAVSLSFFFFLVSFFSFRYCSNGCFSSIHNVNDPSMWNGFPVRAEGRSQDWITGPGKGLGPAWSYRQHCCTVPPLWVWSVTSRGGRFAADGFLCPLEPAVIAEARQTGSRTPGEGLDFHLSHTQQKPSKTWTQTATTWMKSTSSTRPLLSFGTMKTGHALSSHQQQNTPLTPRSQDPTSHQCYSLCWASWKHFLIRKKKKKKKKKSFGGFCAVISNQ